MQLSLYFSSSAKHCLCFFMQQDKLAIRILGYKHRSVRLRTASGFRAYNFQTGNTTRDGLAAE
jgi:hypothetical protein